MFSNFDPDKTDQLKETSIDGIIRVISYVSD